MDLVLALDAGTTGVRCVAYDDRLEPLDEARRPLGCSYPAPGEVEQDPHEIVESARAVLEEVARRQRALGHHVVALGVANQRETTIAFDPVSGRSLGPALVWQDRRTAPRCEALVAEGHLHAVREVTGLVIDPYFSALKMCWLGERNVATPVRYATVDTWIVWHLTGGPEGGSFVTEASNASRTSLMDLGTRKWSPAMGALFGVDVGDLAEIRPSIGPFGVVSARSVAGLAGVPITGVLGDQQAALFGQACFDPGLVKATYGTGAFVLANAGTRRPSDVSGLLSTVAWDLGQLGGPTYALEGSAFSAGAAAQWFYELGLTSGVEELEPLARSVVDSGGASFVPALSGLGSPFWRADARGAFTGLSRGVNRGHLARAIVEALAFQVRAMTDAFRDGGVTLNELRADGGAAVMDLLLELQSTTCGCDVVRSASLEATARGAASLAGVGAGLWSVDQLARSWVGGTRFRPGERPEEDRDYQAWCRAVARS